MSATTRRGESGAVLPSGEIFPRGTKTAAISSLDGRELAAIFLGGAIGALLRVWLGEEFTGAAATWPWVTFSINITGSFALGYFATRLQDRLPQSTYRRPLLGTGFCGAYTTFSTMQVEILKMIEHDHYWLAAGYAAASITLGYLAVWVATAIVRRARVIA
jgi:CrcB protein